ncbi:MAG: hypothetical protein AW10_00929 [Candidatus Accumulibacter appositus]|uniref:Transmembrane protein n=1 Tax=Candidatus Accumulibacter appositus TaxID=1454003 RepID=A0A011NGJ9_9PROT|nr:MAG: hypothetical protein AW10_00929 [Candidatus Accumulibacter appositus]
MTEIVLALGRSLRTLGGGRVWLLFFGPAAVALVIWIVLMVFALESLIATLVEQPPMTWLAGWGAVWLAKLGAVLGGWLLILAAAFITAMLLAAIFVMPLLLNHVALADYPELARVGKDSVVAGAWNSVAALLLYIVGMLLTLPLWLVPPAAMAGARAGPGAADPVDGLADATHLCLRCAHRTCHRPGMACAQT